jgi:hypothetical protein
MGIAVRTTGRRAVGGLALLAVLGASLGCRVAESVVDAAKSTGSPIAREGGTPEHREMTTEGSSGSRGGNAPELGVPERVTLAYPPVDFGLYGSDLNRAVYGDAYDWPEMRYLGEDARVGNVSIRPVEFRVVRGSSVPMAYSPEGDEMVPAPEGSPSWMRQQWNRPVLVIPPSASLVMVRIETTPSVGQWSSPGVYQCPENDTTEYEYSGKDFRMAFPGLGEAPVQLTGDEFWFGEYQSIGSGCPGSGWLYFVVAEMDVDPSQLWLEHIRWARPGGRAFWTLSGRP